MANTATVYARIDPQLKKDVDEILSILGITTSSLIQMLYSEIRNTKRVPLELAIKPRKPIVLEEITKEELEQEVKKGLDSIENGEVYSQDEVERYFKTKSNK